MSSSSDSSNLHGGTSQVVPRASTFGKPAEEQDRSLRDLIRVLKRRRFFILYCGLGMLALAILVCLVLPDKYESTAKLMIDQNNSSGIDLGDLSELASSMGVDDVKMEIDTATAVLQSESNSLMVVQNLGLMRYEPFLYDPSQFYLSPYNWNPALKTEIGKPLDQAPATRERLMRIFDKYLKVASEEDTRLIDISYKDHNPQRAADIANAFVNVYIHKYLEDHFQSTARASDWITGQLSSLKLKVDESQKKLADFESKTGLSVLMLGMSAGTSSGSSGGGSPVSMMTGGVHLPAVDRLTELNGELTAAEADLIAKEAIYHLTQTESPEVVLGLGSSSLASIGNPSSALTSGGGLALLQGLRQQEVTIQQQYGDALSKYGPKNPHLAELEGQLNSVKKAIEEELDRIRQRAKNDVEMSQKNEDAIRAAFAAQQVEVNKLNDSTIQLEVLADDALSNRELYELLESKLQEANIEAGVQATNLSLVDPAVPASLPHEPSWILYPPIGLALGLVLGVGGAFARESLDDVIVTSEEVEKLALLPVLSYIPIDRSLNESRGRKGAAKSTVPPTIAERSPLIARPTSPEAEAYRALRTSILLSGVDTPLRTLLVTSPMSGDGKSTVSYNIAASFALHEKRVLIIDADMRKPRQHIFFEARQTPGLSDLVTGNIRLSDAVITHSSVPLLHLLPAGTPPPNPAELVNSNRFAALLEEAKSQYDYVVIDSPPVLMVTDPVILSTKVDGTIVVIRSRKTRRQILTRVAEMLSKSRGRKLGFVVNGVDTKSVEYYYAYGYYGDNKYYGEEA